MTWIFFASLIVLGGFFAVDLLMGVLGNQYLRKKQALKKLRSLQRERVKKTKIQEDQVLEG